MADWQNFLTQYKAPSDVWGAYQQLQSLAPLDSGVASKVASYKAPTDQAGAYNARFNQNPYGFTPQEQTTYDTYNNQRNGLTNKLLDFQHKVNPTASPFTRFMHGIESLPVIGDVAAGANEVFGRPGDLFNNPAKFIGKAAAGAAPFLGGEIGPWSKVMGFGGKALAGGGFNNPANLIGAGLSLAAPFVGGNVGQGLSIGGKLYNAARNASAGGNGMDWGSFLGSALGGIGQAAGLPSWSSPLINAGLGALTGGSSGQQGGQAMNAYGYGGGNGGGQAYPGYSGGGGNGVFGGGTNWNQLAGQIGAGINLFTDPSGIKLFGGGNYADNGMGDKALGYANTLGNTGNQFLNAGLPQKIMGGADNFNTQGQSFLNKGNNGLPSLSNLGQLSNMPNIIGQIADTAGIQNPLTGQGGSSDPYALHPHEQEAFNSTANMVNQGRQGAISNLRQQLASKGINDPRAIAAAEAAINASHNNMLQQGHAQLATQAFQNRQQAQTQLSQLFPQLYGAQNQAQQQAYGNAADFLGMGQNANSGALNAGANLLNLPINAYQNAAQQAINQNRYSRNQIGQGISNLFPPSATGQFGGLIPHYGQGQGSPWVQPGQPGFDTGAGNPGGVGPMPDMNGGGGIDYSNYNPWAQQSYSPDFENTQPWDASAYADYSNQFSGY